MRPPSAICHTSMSQYSMSISNVYLPFGSKKIIHHNENYTSTTKCYDKIFLEVFLCSIF